MVQDTHRPQYHFLPPSNWMNDPNGLVHWQGRYHMFYQYNPFGAQWGNMHWGHTDSPDLVYWTHRPIGLAPQSAGPDADGCFSGCAVALEDRVAFLYTGVKQKETGGFRETTCLAWGDGNLETLHHDPANPLIAAPPPELKPTGFRDHSVWKVGDQWRMAIGSGDVDRGPMALLYGSPDLRSWEYLGPLCQGKDAPPAGFSLGNMWECPSVFFDGEQAALIVSGCGDGGYGPTIMTGEYTDPRFYPRRVEKLDHGGTAFYAPQTFRDAKGRILMFGWLTEARGVEAMVRAGWSGVMSLPRRVWIDSEGKPRYAFVPELESLRTAGLHLRDERIADPSGEPRPLEMETAQAEVILDLERGSASVCGLSLLRSPDGEEETRLAVDWEKGILLLDRSRSSLVEAGLTDLSAPLPRVDGRLRLHLYLDGSTVECILDERVALTGRIYPSRAGSRGLGLFAAGGDVNVRSLQLYQLAAAW